MTDALLAPTGDFLHQDDIHQTVRDTYRQVPPGDGGVAARFYEPEELDGIPEATIRMALGVGNPVRHAGLRPGERVLDLGSGAGIDCLVAARRVAPGGSVLGVDFLPTQVERATAAAGEMGLDNVRFVEAEIESLPVSDASVEVIISNGVLNLSPRKVRVLAEAYRVLAPGGRLAVVDLVLEHDLPPEIATSPAAWAGCLSGALSEVALYKGLRRAGFRQVGIRPLDDFGIAEVALYPLFTDELLGLLRDRVPPERQARIAKSVVVTARKAAEGERLRGRADEDGPATR